MPTSSSKFAAVGAVCVSCTLLGWASVPLFIKYFTQQGHYLDPWTANGWRYSISAALLLPVVLLHARRRALPAGIWRRAVVPSLFNCAGQICFATAPYYIGVGLMAFLLRFQIIFVTLGAYMMFPSERRVLRAPLYWMGVLLVFGGLAGTVVLGDTAFAGGSAIGVALGTISGVFFAGYALSVRHFMHGCNPVLSFGVISLYTAGALVGLMFAFSDSRGTAPVALGAGGIGMLGISSIVGIGLGHIFYYMAIARLGVSISAGVILLAPFMTAVGSFFIYGERLTAAQWISGTTALVGAGMILSRQHRYTRPPSDAPAAAKGAEAPPVSVPGPAIVLDEPG